MYLNDPEGDIAESEATVSKVTEATNEDADFLKTPQGNILGGEASMWSEQVDPTSFDGRIWPRHALWQSVCGLRRICVMWKKHLSG